MQYPLEITGLAVNCIFAPQGPDIETTQKRLRAECRSRLEAWLDEFDAETLERALREGVSKGSTFPTSESPFSRGRDEESGPVVVGGTSDIRPFRGLPDDIVDEVLDESLGEGLLGVRAADGRVVGLDGPPLGRGTSPFRRESRSR